MALIAGSYQLVRNENFVEYLVGLETPEENAKLVDSLKPKLVVRVDGKKISFISDSGVDNSSPAFVVDEEVEEKMPNNVVIKSLAKLDGNTLTIASKTPKGQTGTRVYAFSDTELVVTMKTDGLPTVAKRVYKRI